jgi:hypothetical protein
MEKTKTEGAEKNIWAQEEGSNKRLEKLHNEELHHLYSSLNRPIMRMTKSRRMRLSGILYTRDEKCTKNISQKS